MTEITKMINDLGALYYAAMDRNKYGCTREQADERRKAESAIIETFPEIMECIRVQDAEIERLKNEVKAQKKRKISLR